MHQLEKILASAIFSGSARLSRFLRYTVELSTDGRNDQLKEYLLGVDVFDRGESFDPRTGAVVRVEAGRLRTKLREYYASDGRNDPVVIALPKGSYAPAFAAHSPGFSDDRWNKLRVYRYSTWALATAVLVFVSLWVHGLVSAAPPLPLTYVAVLPFEDLNGTQTSRFFADGLVDELASSLSNVHGLKVASRASAFQFNRNQTDLAEVGRALKVGSVVQGRVRHTGSRIRITVELVGIASGYRLWSAVYERDIENTEQVFGIQNKIAHAVTRALAPRLVTGWQSSRKVVRP